MRNTIKDANLADKLSAEDKEKIEKAVDKVVEWLDHNQVSVGIRQERRRGKNVAASVLCPIHMVLGPAC